MDSALWSAASGMIARQRDVEVTANNLANASVQGFRPESTFYRLWRRVGGADGSGREEASNSGVQVPSTFTRLEPGPLLETGAPLDLAIEGDAWLAVRTPRGERYTRGGSFRRESDGTIATFEKMPLLGSTGPLRVTGKKIDIDPSGLILADGEEAGKLRLVRTEPGDLAKEGDGLYRLRDGARVLPAGPDVAIRQRFVETSGVQPVQELVRLITAQRAFEQHSRTVQLIANEIDRKAANEIAQS
jgi:flagellar basal-body rod protein FlgF